MTSRTEICNFAGQEIGQPPITDIEEGSFEADRYLLIYDSVVAEVTGSKFWSVVKEKVELARLPDPPLFEFSFQFQLPSDNLRVIGINEREASGFKYKIESGKLLFNDDSIKITYIKKQDDPTLWGTDLQRSIVLRLAAGICYSATHNITLTKEAYDAYFKYARLSSGKDSNQGSRKPYNAVRTTRVR